MRQFDHEVKEKSREPGLQEYAATILTFVKPNDFVIVGVGIDIESVERFRKMRKEVFELVTRRVLTERERDYCFAKADPYPCVAARFCSKEAFAKALGIERPASVPFRDVEVLGKPPKLVARGVAAELLAKLGVDRVHVSISHTRDYAAAVVVLERSY